VEPRTTTAELVAPPLEAADWPAELRELKADRAEASLAETIDWPEEKAAEAAEAIPDCVRRLVPPKLCRAEDKMMTAGGTEALDVGDGAATWLEGIGTTTVRDWPVYVGRTIVVVRAEGVMWLGTGFHRFHTLRAGGLTSDGNSNSSICCDSRDHERKAREDGGWTHVCW
jgi:hypothetical protein